MSERKYYNAMERVAKEYVARGLFEGGNPELSCDGVGRYAELQIAPYGRQITGNGWAIEIPPYTTASEIRKMINRELRKIDVLVEMADAENRTRNQGTLL